MEFELVSANYNNAPYLDSYFESLINSLKPPKAVIIVDDASTDNSVEIIESYSKRINIKLIKNQVNKGFANSLNLALEELTAPFFARLDPDDYVYPERFAEQLRFFEQNPQADIVGSNVTYVLNNINKSASNVPSKPEKIQYYIRNGILPIIHGTIMMRSDKISDFRYKQENVPAEDYDLFAYSISKGYKIDNLEAPLTYVRVHANSVSNELKFSAVRIRFELASRYFSFHASKMYILFEFLHLKYYRKYLFEGGSKRYLYIFYSAALSPVKSLRKVFRIQQH